MEKKSVSMQNKVKKKCIDKSKGKDTNAIKSNGVNNNKNGTYNNNDKKINNKNLKPSDANVDIKNYSDNNENDSFCYECYHGGNLVCCDNCIRSYHLYCLSSSDKPQPNFNYWYCPLCKRRGVTVDASLKRRKKIKTIKTVEKKKDKVKQKSEGSKYTNQINVGENYQVSNVSTFFLNSHSEKYDETSKSELVYSPYLLERMKENYLSEGQYELVIKNDYELAIFIKELAKNWKCQLGWHPFTPEYAFKILHHVDYNPKKAIELLKSSEFNFLEICDPPIRKYENKWRPRDKRGQISDSPYPSSELLQSYLKRSVEFSLDEKKYHYPVNTGNKFYCEINKNNIIETNYPNERTRNSLRKEIEEDEDEEDDYEDDDLEEEEEDDKDDEEYYEEYDK
ncbi:phd finger protein, putative [Plasmodium sp. gorilla clade G1]|nr:phd finger protein, putative [Plasmodium sp. gorilla clade G1]